MRVTTVSINDEQSQWLKSQQTEQTKFPLTKFVRKCLGWLIHGLKLYIVVVESKGMNPTPHVFFNKKNAKDSMDERTNAMPSIKQNLYEKYLNIEDWERKWD